MPRDGSGNYTLPPGYLATPGTTIFDTQHNAPLEDIAQEITKSLPVDGTKPMAENLLFAAGKTPILNVDGTGNQAVRASQLPPLIAVRNEATVVDLNTFTTVDRFTATDPTNAPVAGGSRTWLIEVFNTPADPDSVTQRATLVNGGAAITVLNRRRTFAGTWEAWSTAGVTTIAAATDVDTARRVDGKGLWWDAAAGQHIYAWASPLDATIDLRDLLDEQHGVGGWTQRTGVNTGTNCTVALTLGLDRLRARYGRGTIKIPPGTWLFNTQIDPAKLSGITLEGIHELASQMVWAGGAVDFLRWSGASAYSGGAIRRMGMYREDGFSAVSTGIMLQGDATFQPDQFTVENIYMSALGTGYWSKNLFLSGQARTSPQGLRVVSGRNLQLFRSGSGGGYGAGFFNVVQGDFTNVGTYVGTGALGTNVYVGGGGTTSTNTTQFTLDRLACGGELNLTSHTRAKYDGFCANLAMAGTADFVWGWLDASSTAGALGANSNLIIR